MKTRLTALFLIICMIIPLNVFGEENMKVSDTPNIGVGFNTKATLDYKNQCLYLDKELALLKTSGVNTQKIWLRLNGGTISQKTMPSDWSEDMIKSWNAVQDKYGCKYVFVVNFNDSPKSQKLFYDRLVKGGIVFSGIELGNEQYLPKFAGSKITKDEEVTERTKNMTPEKYIAMSNEYIAEFGSINLPFYVQFAPQKEDKIDYTNWNKRIAKAINENEFKTKNIVGSIHLYERDGNGSLDTNQVNNIRALVNKSLPMAVTESGVVDKTGKVQYNKIIDQEKYLISRVLGSLKTGDLYFNQVLYTDYKKVGPEIIHPQYKGLTPKGKSVLEILKKYWK